MPPKPGVSPLLGLPSMPGILLISGMLPAPGGVKPPLPELSPLGISGGVKPPLPELSPLGISGGVKLESSPEGRNLSKSKSRPFSSAKSCMSKSLPFPRPPPMDMLSGL